MRPPRPARPALPAAVGAVGVLLMAVACGAGGGQPTPSPAPDPSLSASPSLTATPSGSPIPSPSATPAPSQSPKPPAKPAPKPTAPPRTTATSAVLAGTHCSVFPASNVWHADISHLPVDPRAAKWLASMGTTAAKKLHPDFGPNYDDPANPYGISITIASAGTPRVAVSFDYTDESDRVRYPLSSATKIEGGKDSDGDRHAIVVTADTCELFETFDTHQTPSGWTAGSGAHWSLNSNTLRPDGWTSADAAGLPILAGLLRYDEVRAGRVDHAIRFTANCTAASHIWPARHDAGSASISQCPPMGARFRLKASYSMPGARADTQAVIRAMKAYGLILADNGSNWYFTGAADTRWNGDFIEQLKRIPANAFEAVSTSGLRVSANSAQAR